VRLVLPCWTGTMVGYDKPGKQLGESIEYTDPKTRIKYVFPVPKEYRKRKDIALVVEHPDFTLEVDGKNRVVNAREVGVVPDIPG
jgi:hypothetical protein